MIRSILPTLTALLALGACKVGPNYRSPETTAPANWTGGQGTSNSAEALRLWWQGFHDPVLSHLIQQAIDGNYDLRIAGQRIRAAQDAVRVAAAADLPQIGIGEALESRRQTQTIDFPAPSPKFGVYPYYQLGFNASWELDLFGETQRRRESARAAVAAAIETRRGLLVSLTAAIASDYAGFRAAEARLQIARQSLDIARQSQKLAHRAFEAGEQSHLDVSQADARVHEVEASIPPLQAQSETLLHALAILLGRNPEEFSRADLEGDPAIPVAPPLPASLPSEVIARRPDIRRAEREYAQSNANVGVAVAGLYPHFSIPLSVGPTTSSIRETFQHASLLWRVGLDGTQSLYTGGKLSAQVDAARAGKSAVLLSYRQTVLKAFAEVEDALSNQAAEQARYQSVDAQVAANRQAVDEAQQRYRNGEVSFLPVLDTERQFYAAQNAQVGSTLTRCLASIDLYKALGGGWEGIELSDVAADDSR